MKSLPLRLEKSESHAGVTRTARCGKRSAPRVPGTFVGRVCGLAAALMTLAAGGLDRAQAAPSVITDHFTYLPGERIVASFQGGPGNRLDWIGLYPDGVVPGSVGSTDWRYVDNTQTSSRGLTEGSVTFPNGLNTAGDWVAFFLRNDGYDILAQTSFRVIDPGQPFVRTVKRIHTNAEPITVVFTNGPANPKDWIAIYPAGVVPAPGSPSLLWFYLNGSPTSGAGQSEGSVTFSGGLAAAGNYVAYLLLDDGYDQAASEPFSVIIPPSLPRFLTFQPANNSSNLPPIVAFTASITNSATQVATNTLALFIDGTRVTPHITQQSELITVTFTNTALYAPGSVHTVRLEFSDNGAPRNSVTNSATFTVANYRNIVLPAPVFFENFNATAEGSLPAGWSQTNFTDTTNPEFDLGNLDSASYAGWVVVNVDRFRGSFVTYSNPDNPDNWETDYQRVLTPNPLNIVDGGTLSELATGRMVFGNSGYRNGASQVLYLYSPDIDLRGKSDIHLSFHSLWEQNQDSIGLVEYSIDEGRTWLPVVYLLNAGDIVRDATGNIDAVATFSTEAGDIARYLDPVTQVEIGGTYGAFIGAPISAALAEFISPRLDDNLAESKRVELFRLAQADNQAKVRLRFGHAGTDSWYFGLDDVGLYAMGTPVGGPSLSLRREGAQLVISWPADASGFTLESTDSLTAPVWTPVTGAVNNSVTIVPQNGPRFYRLRK